MLNRKLIRFIDESDMAVMALNFFTGAVMSSLFIVAASLNLDLIPFQYLPLICIGSVIMATVLNKMVEKYHNTYDGAYLFALLTLGGVISSFHFSKYSEALYYSNYGKWVAVGLSITAGIVLLKLNSILGSMVKKHCSHLKNYHFNSQSFTAKASGSLISFLGIMIAEKFNHQALALGFVTITNLFALISLYSAYFHSDFINRDDYYELNYFINQDRSIEFSSQNLPFLNLFIAVSAIGLIVTYLQGFTFIVGAYEFKEAKRISTGYFMSIIGLIFSFTSLLTHVIYEKSLSRYQNRWLAGHYIYYLSAIMFIPLLIIKLSPSAMLMSGALSLAICFHIYAKHQQILWNKIPAFAKSKLTNIYYIAIMPAATIFSLILAYSTIVTRVPMNAIWLFTAIFSFLAIILCKELNKIFSDYHVSDLMSSDVYSAVECCTYLRNPESNQHYSALSSMLKQKPRPILAKTIISTLAEMENPQVARQLIDYFYECNRDDIKVEIMRALSNFESHHLDLFFLDTMEELIKEDAFNSEDKRVMFQVISNRLEKVAIPTLLKILKQHSDNFRVIANSILVLGEIAQKTQDSGLFTLLSKYIDPIYSRRIRANASLFLYDYKEYHSLAHACIGSLITSDNEYDRNAVAYIAGELRINSLTPYVLEMAKKSNFTSHTQLIALLKLSHYQACDILTGKLVEINLQEASLVPLLKELYMIKNPATRHLIYYNFLNKYPDKANHLLNCLSLSEKNFDQDRMAIRAEMNRRQIALEMDFKLFQSSTDRVKKVA